MPARSIAAVITSATGAPSARSSAALAWIRTRGSPESAVARALSILAARRDRGACCRMATVLRVVRRESASGGGLLLKLCWDAGRSGGTLVHYRRFERPRGSRGTRGGGGRTTGGCERRARGGQAVRPAASRARPRNVVGFRRAVRRRASCPGPAHASGEPRPGRYSAARRKRRRRRHVPGVRGG